MALEFLIKGLVIGFSIAAPVGPIGVLCIRRTLAQGRWFGLVSGLGAASADAIYGSIAGFGLTVISQFLVDQQTAFRLIGGLFLCYLGLRTFRAHPVDHAAEARDSGLCGAYFSTLGLTLTNPVTILSFAAIFAGLGIIDSHFSALILVLGVFLGSASWWLLLSGLVSMFRVAFDPARLFLLNRLSGLILVIFGVLALVSIV
ncbi:MAG TPA: LysE family transporter [Aggregatilineaceae bacterium]|nr:LysE family transporter [Aggregatilineaceae bacterium]